MTISRWNAAASHRRARAVLAAVAVLLLRPIGAWSAAPNGEPAFAGLWSAKVATRGGGGTGAFHYDQSWDQLVQHWKTLGDQGQYLADVEAYRSPDGALRFAAVWRVGPRQGALLLAPWEQFTTTWKDLGDTQELIDLEVIRDGADWKFLGVWRRKPKPAPGSGAMFVGLSWDALVAKRAALANKQYLADVETFVRDGKRMFAGVWRLGKGNGALYWKKDWPSFAAVKHQLNAKQRMIDFDMFQDNAGRWNFLGVWRVASGAGPLAASGDKQHFEPLKASDLVGLWKARAADFTLTGLAVATPGGAREASHVRSIDYLGNFPSDRNTGWTEDLQGVATDSGSWYFNNKYEIWKFPLTHDLNARVTSADPKHGILHSFHLGPQVDLTAPGLLVDHTPSELKGYNHFGDPDVYEGKLYVPVEKEKSDWTPRIAVFDTRTLSFIDSYPLKPGNGFKQTHAGWCAIDPLTGYLYTSNNGIGAHNPLFVYRVRFDSARGLVLDFRKAVPLWQRANQPQEIKPYMQGGVFSADGSTLYLLSGKDRKFDPKDGGIWVFDAGSGRFIAKSAGSGNFKYQFHPGAARLQEPEGLAFLDLDAKHAPRIQGGQLHAILLNGVAGPAPDSFWFKHYRVHTDN